MKHIIISILLFSINQTLILCQIVNSDSLSQNKPIVVFETDTYDFGKCIDGELIKHTYTFQNKGTKVLHIDTIKSYDSKIILDLSTKSIEPNQYGKINIIYNSKGRSRNKLDGRKESKRITITTNAEPPNYYFYVKGTVYPNVEEKTDLENNKDALNSNTDNLNINNFKKDHEDLNEKDHKSISNSSDEFNITGKWVGQNDKHDDSTNPIYIFDKEGYAFMTVDEDGTIFGGEINHDGIKGSLTYTIDRNKNPIEIDIILTNFTDKTQKNILLIGTFIDTNTLKLAGNTELSVRPIEFNESNTIIFKRN